VVYLSETEFVSGYKIYLKKMLEPKMERAFETI
jgi:hypothetical protein